MKLNSYKIFIDNVPVGIELKDLQDAFKHIGKVVACEIYQRPTNEKVINNKIEKKTTEHGFLYFENIEGHEKALSPMLRIFGLPIKGNLCRTSNVEDHRTLYIGNLSYGMTSNEIMSSLNRILSSSLKIKLEDHSLEGICISNHGYCFIEFESHTIASLAFLILNNCSIQNRKLKVGWSFKPTPNQESKILSKIDDMAISKSFVKLNNIESDIDESYSDDNDTDLEFDDLTD